MYCRVCVTPENFHTFWRFGNPKTLFSEIQTIPSFLSDRTFVEVHPPVKEYEENHQNMDCVVGEYRDCVLLIGNVFQGNRKSKNISGKSKAQTIDLSPHCILSMDFTLSKSGRLWLLQRDISISDPVAALRFFPPRPCSWDHTSAWCGKYIFSHFCDFQTLDLWFLKYIPVSTPSSLNMPLYPPLLIIVSDTGS